MPTGEASANTALIGLIGREAELDRLGQLLAEDRSVAVVGEAGVGKTSLIRAALAASGRGVREGGGFATLMWLPYLALSRAIDRAVTGDAGVAAASVERALGPDVLFVDDLHWVDGPSRAVIERLAGRAQVVVAIRSGDPAADDAIALATRLGFDPFRLEGLDDADAGALVRRVAEAMPASDVARTVRLSGGNPLLLEEMARAGAGAAVFGRNLERRRAALGPAARLELDLLAVVGRPIPASRFSAATELLRSGLVRRREEALEIRHALLAEAIGASLDPDELRAVHAAAAEATDDVAERARHLLAAGRADAAAEVARAGLAAEPDRLLEGVLRATLAKATGALSDRVAAARTLLSVGDFAGMVDVVPADVPDDDPDLRREALYLRGVGLYRAFRPAESETLLTGAWEAGPPGTPTAGRLAQELAMIAINQRGDLEWAFRLVSDELARQPPGSAVATRLAVFREAIRLYMGESPDLDLMIAALDRAVEAGEPDLIARSRNLFKTILVLRGAIPALEFATATAARLAAHASPAATLDLIAEASRAALYGGRLTEAVALADEALDNPTGTYARVAASVARAEALADLGQFDLAEVELAQAGATAGRGDRGDRSEVLMAEVELAYWSGASRRAVEVADRLAAHGSSSDVNLALPHATAAWAELDLGRPIREVQAFDLRAIEGLPIEVAGVRALAADDAAAAIEAFDRAASLHDGFLVPRAAACRWGAAEASRRAGAPDAMARLEAAEREAAAMGFAPLLAKVHRSMRLAGVRISERRQATPTPLGLTGREAEVVRLVAEGLTNIEVARRLGLGRPTVNRMLSSAMAKVGAERRGQLVSVVPPVEPSREPA